MGDVSAIPTVAAPAPAPEPAPAPAPVYYAPAPAPTYYAPEPVYVPPPVYSPPPPAPTPTTIPLFGSAEQQAAIRAAAWESEIRNAAASTGISYDFLKQQFDSGQSLAQAIQAGQAAANPTPSAPPPPVDTRYLNYQELGQNQEALKEYNTELSRNSKLADIGTRIVSGDLIPLGSTVDGIKVTDALNYVKSIDSALAADPKFREMQELFKTMPADPVPEETQKSVLDRIKAGEDLTIDDVTSAGFGSTDGFKHSFKFAHPRSPAYAAMAANFDPQYGTKGNRAIVEEVAKRIGFTDVAKLEQIAGKEFASAIASNEYSIYDTESMNRIANKVLDEVGYQLGRPLPQAVKDNVNTLNQRVYALTEVPHPEKSGFFKQAASSIAGNIIDLAEAGLKPFGLEQYAVPIATIGATVASGGNPAVAALVSSLPAIEAQKFDDALKAGVTGALVAGAGNLAAGTVSGAIGSTGSSVVDAAIKGGVSGVTEAALTGQDIKSGLLGGLIGAGVDQIGSNIYNKAFGNDPTLLEGTDATEPVEVPSGGAGSSNTNPFGDLGLTAGQLIGDKPISGIGINTGNFNQTPIDPLNPNFGNFGGSFGSNEGIIDPTTGTPKLGANNGIGITIPIFNSTGQQVGSTGTGGSLVGTDFNVPLGNPNSFVNNPTVTGVPLVSGGTVTNTPNYNTTLTDLANGNIGSGVTGSSNNTANNGTNPLVQQLGAVGIDYLKNQFFSLFNKNPSNPLQNPTPVTGNTGTKPVTGTVSTPQQPSPNIPNRQQFLLGLLGNRGGTQNLNFSGANMADYLGLLGNILSQNAQIDRLESTGNQIYDRYNTAAADLNKPFTPFNITSGAGSTKVSGQDITQQLTGGQKQLADLAGKAAGMFGAVSVPNATNIQNQALSGASGLLQQASGFNPQSAAQTEFDALQQLYAPQRERERLALENRLLAQGRLGASENPALRQMEETFRTQDLQGAIQSRDLAFQRQQQLQNMAQGLFNTGSAASKLPIELQAAKANIGTQMGNLSQLPYQTANQQAQLANQLAATQSSQGTALANIMGSLKDRGLTTQAGLISQAAALKNARDVAAIQALLGGGNPVGQAVNGVIGGALGGIGNAIGGALGGGGSGGASGGSGGGGGGGLLGTIGGVLGAGAGAIGGALGGIGNAIGGLFSGGYQNPANGGLTTEQVKNMSDDEFLDFIIKQNNLASYNPSAPFINPANLGFTTDQLNQMSDDDFLTAIMQQNGLLSSVTPSLPSSASLPWINPANGGLSSAQLDAMSDDDFLDFLLNFAGD